MSNYTFKFYGEDVTIKTPYYACDKTHVTFIDSKGAALSIRYTDATPSIRQSRAEAFYSQTEYECSEQFFLKQFNRALKFMHPLAPSGEEIDKLKNEVHAKNHFIGELIEENQDHKTANARLMNNNELYRRQADNRKYIAIVLGCCLALETIVGVCIYLGIRVL